ncbi:FbpB family small basic protein [Pontibacillus halophilus]|nr:FbpB family small basic protein [Pontibacillus halophilus]
MRPRLRTLEELIAENKEALINDQQAIDYIDEKMDDKIIAAGESRI